MNIYKEEEDTQKNMSPCLDWAVHIGHNGRLNAAVYWKPKLTQTDICILTHIIHWNINPLSSEL